MVKKGQTSMILIVLMIVIFMAIGIFIVISSLKTEYEDYNNLYAHNILLSTLRRTTGHGGYCDTISSTISCAYMTSYRNCGGVTCRNLSMEIVPKLIDTIIKEDFEYCMIIEPDNWTVMGGDRIVFGPRCDTVLRKSQRWTANERILQEGANLNIQMIITKD
ncbi:MAG: hypothetical protein KAS04_04720 [Candidatus Aenigmarchaeota archaeon]|nr:hypothetical protein [Candidatus Aenigmarchaeota archaeon]